MKRYKTLEAGLILAGTCLFFTGTASAHVTVWPKQSTTSAYEKYTVRVPVEKDVNTTKVRVEFPADVTVSSVEPVPGWNYSWEKDANGRIQAITWTATAGGVKPHEFIEFPFIAVNPKQPGQITWKAYQTYADGSVVEWTGAPDSKTPASVTTIQQGAATGDSHGEQHPTAAHEGADAADQGKASSSNTWTLVLSVIALLLSLISLFRKKS
jgi:uncharacterized protein YcnI